MDPATRRTAPLGTARHARVRGSLRAARAAPALVAGALWWWAALRLAVTPRAGTLECAVVVGGWGLSVLPVHCVPRSRAGRVAPPWRLPGRLWARAGARVRHRLRYACVRRGG